MLWTLSRPLLLQQKLIVSESLDLRFASLFLEQRILTITSTKNGCKSIYPVEKRKTETMGCTASTEVQPPSRHRELKMSETSDSSGEFTAGTPALQHALRHRNLKKVCETSKSSTGKYFDCQRTPSYFPDTAIRRSQPKLQHSYVKPAIESAVPDAALAANQSTTMQVDEQVATFEPAVSCTETSPNKTSAVTQVDEQEVTVKPAVLDTEPSSNTASAAKQVDEALSAVQAYLGSPLNSSDKVMCMQLWNKVLAFQSSFTEALVLEWRLLVERDREPYGVSKYHAFEMVETNKDLLAGLLQDRLCDVEALVCGLIDGAIRSLCPRTQQVGREAYRPIADTVHLARANEHLSLHFECESVHDYLVTFARCGVPPDAWVHFLRAIEWTLKTHVPYAREDDKDDIANGPHSSVLRALGQLVSIPAINAWKEISALVDSPLVRVALPRFWKRVGSAALAEISSKMLERMQSHPDVLNFLIKSDAHSLPVQQYLATSIDTILKSMSQLTTKEGPFRSFVSDWGEALRKMGLPSCAYPLLGSTMMECLEPFLQAEEKISQRSDFPVSAFDLRTTSQLLYSYIISLLSAPMVRQEKLLDEARRFYQQVQVELKWNEQQFEHRMGEVEQEIVATRTYTQTSKEIELGGRLAWRNSTKCIGRIAWNTLQVRDCRHITDSDMIFEHVEEHLRIATAGSNIKSVMTCFQPLKPGESIGPRFWSSQCVRYAGYRNAMSGQVLGDSANVGLTEYLEAKKLWTPPEPKSEFDVLPLVFKQPNQEAPKIHHLSKDCIFEVLLEHPTCAEFKNLGLRWTALPAITNFKMNIGGVIYPNTPFNGWFVSTEIVRNLMERYDVGQRVSNIFNINTRADAFWRQAATLELERAVIYSFTKRGFTIIDPHAVGKSFCTHVRREREQFGRECPAQWSWIGGLTGPTNDSWHLEMRDFVVTPKYEYAVTGEALYSSLDGFVDHSSEDSEIAWHEPERKAPRVLILYGSETGHAESLARTLRCLLGALKPTLMTLNEAAGLDAVLVQGFSHVLCLVSTFGDGDAPSNARAFFKKELPSLSSVHSPVYFSVLALGSTLYPHFCKAGVDLDRKLEVAGLIRLTEGVDKADALEGSEDTIKNWICRVKTSILPPSIEHAITTKSHQKGPCQRSTTILKWRLQLGPKYMVVAEQERAQSLCISNRVRGGKWMSSKRIRPKKKVGGNEKSQSLGSMLAIGHVSHTNARSIRRITFKVPPGQTYETGDHISVQPMNSGASVERFLGCFRDELQRQARISCPSADIDLLQWQAEQIFDLEIKEGGIRRPADVVFRTPTTLETLLSRVLEFGMNMTVAKDLLRLCIDVCQQEQSNREEMSEFLSAMVPVLMGNSDPERFIARFPTVTHFFECFGFLLSTTDGVPPLVTLGEVLVRLPRLQPRFYSISSSSKASPKDLSITVGVLNCETSQKVKFDGVCSNFLAGLRSGRDTAQISIRKSTFRLPQVLDCPIVMVSTGTGISPMVGFLHDLVIAKSNGVTIGEVHLFFGCRTEDEFLYREEIEHCVASGLVTLHLAVSRSEYQPKEYVQDLIRKMGSAFSELLMQPDTAYYVCGSARVAAECREAAIDGLREHEGLRDTQAVHHIEQMSLDNRWQSDIWGALLGNEQARSSALLPLVLPPLVLPPSIPQSIRAQVRKSIY